MSRLRKRGVVAVLAAALLFGSGGAAVAAPGGDQVCGRAPTALERVWSGIRNLLGLDQPRSDAASDRHEPKARRGVTPPAAPPTGESETDAGGSLDPDG